MFLLILHQVQIEERLKDKFKLEMLIYSNISNSNASSV